MTRAKDISKIVTDADLSGTLDVTGTVTAGGLTVHGTADVDNLVIDNAGKISSVGQIEFQVDSDNNQSGTYFGFSRNNTTSERIALFQENGDISFYEDTGTTPKLFWDASAERLGIGTTSPSRVLHISHPTVGGMKLQATTDNYDAFVEFKTVDNNAFIGLDDSLNLLKINNDAGVGAYNHLVVDTSGNVGIGTSSPSDILHIKNVSSTNVLIDAPTDNASLTLQCGSSDAGAEGAFINFIQNTTSKWQLGMNTDNSFRLYNYNTTSETFRVSPAGNVGIGVTSLTQKFEVAGKGVFSTANPDVNGLEIKATTGTNPAAMRFSNTATAYVGLDNSVGGRISGVPYGLAVWNGSAYPVVFGTNGSERMRITSAGNVGIGSTNPSSKLQVEVSAGTNGLNITDASASDFIVTPGVSSGVVRVGPSVGSMAFYTSNSERMRIDSSGNFLVGTTSQIGAGKTSIAFDRTSQWGMAINNTSSTAPNPATMIEFQYAGTSNGYIQSNGSSTSYNTSSDHRLKENVSYDFDATTRLKQLRPARFNFIADADTTVDGFLAHEVQSVVPEAITGTHNEVDDDGNPVYQGIDQSKLVPLLVKTIQELEARIVALETA
jgi:hypothetical protein